jgi:perosamine synthetase
VPEESPERFIPVNEPVLAGNERQYVLECLDSGWISSEGPFVARFEQAVAARVGRGHGIAVSSGSAALDVAVAALGLGAGDEVIMPTFTIISCATAVIRAGAVPVLVDADPLTWNMDPEQVRSRITAQTRAIMVVHVYGLPVDMDPILALASRFGLAVIEDAAQMLGQTHRGRPCGGFGHISTFSFYANKHVTTGEGGMIVTDDAQLASRCRSLRNLCFVPGHRFRHEELGWNYRFTNLQAALGLAQLERLDEVTARKRHLGARYTELLEGVPGLQLPVRETPYARNIYWAYGIVLAAEVPLDAPAAIAALTGVGVGTRPFFWPMHQQPSLLRMDLFAGERHPVAERLAARGLYLPSGAGLTSEQVESVAAAVRDLVGGSR